MGKVILRWIIRPPTETHQDEDVPIDEDNLWQKILIRLQKMGLIKNGHDNNSNS